MCAVIITSYIWLSKENAAKSQIAISNRQAFQEFWLVYFNFKKHCFYFKSILMKGTEL